MAYFLPRLLPDLKISPLVPFLPRATSEEGVAEVVALHVAFYQGFTPLSIFQTVTAFFALNPMVWLQIGLKAAKLAKPLCVAYF